MKDSLFWRCLAVLGVAALFYLAAGLHGHSLPAPSSEARAQNFAQASNRAKRSLNWQALNSSQPDDGWTKTYRAKVPGGWLIQVFNIQNRGNNPASALGLIFYPDPNHTWNGGSLP